MRPQLCPARQSVASRSPESDGFKERLNSCEIVTIPRTAHGDLKVVLAQDLKVVV